MDSRLPARALPEEAAGYRKALTLRPTRSWKTVSDSPAFESVQAGRRALDGSAVFRSTIRRMLRKPDGDRGASLLFRLFASQRPHEDTGAPPDVCQAERCSKPVHCRPIHEPASPNGASGWRTPFRCASSSRLAGARCRGDGASATVAPFDPCTSRRAETTERREHRRKLPLSASGASRAPHPASCGPQPVASYAPSRLWSKANSASLISRTL